MRYLSGYSFHRIEAKSTPLSIPIEGQPEEAFITLQGGSIRYRYDGKDPDEFTGHLLHDGMSLRLTGIGQLQNFRFILSSELPGSISLTLEKE